MGQEAASTSSNPVKKADLVGCLAAKLSYFSTPGPTFSVMSQLKELAASRRSGRKRGLRIIGDGVAWSTADHFRKQCLSLICGTLYGIRSQGFFTFFAKCLVYLPLDFREICAGPSAGIEHHHPRGRQPISFKSHALAIC